MILCVYLVIVLSTSLLRNQTEFSRKIDFICKHDVFSKIEVDLGAACLYPELMQECKLWECLFFTDKSKLQQLKKLDESRVIVDLLLNPESFTENFKGKKEIWNRLKTVNNNEIYQILLGGIRQSIAVHISAFYKKSGNDFLKNVMLFRKNCKKDRYVDCFRLLRIFLLFSLKRLEIANNIKHEWLSDLKSYVTTTCPTFPALKKVGDDFERSIDLTNCLPCLKCRIWAEIQFRGLSAACRIMSGECITEKDLIYYINLLNRNCVAEHEYNIMNEMLNNYYWNVFMLYQREWFTLSLAILLFFVILMNKTADS